MCNYYRHDLRKLGREREFYGFEEISELPRDIYPDRLAPVIRLGEGGRREWKAMRWGFPPPKEGRPVTNIRNLESRYWRGWFKPEFRCLVPFDRFAEFDDHSPAGAKLLRWFAHPGEAPGYFAGLWRPWTGTRGTKKEPVTGEHLLFGFLTCEANNVVRPIHEKAMPVILHTIEAQEAWLTAPAEAVPMMAQPLPDHLLKIVSA